MDVMIKNHLYWDRYKSALALKRAAFSQLKQGTSPNRPPPVLPPHYRAPPPSKKKTDQFEIKSVDNAIYRIRVDFNAS